MPKLIYFLACERVLVNEESPTPSLISIFDRVSAPTPPKDVSNPQAGMPWVLISNWKKLPEDEGKVYEQRTLLMNPEGISSLETIIQFTIPSPTHRNTVRIFGFPLTPVGEYHAQLFIRDVGTVDWKQVGEYSIDLNYIE